jgi:biotin operon repressor
MKPLGEVLEKNIKLIGADNFTENGFTQVPNAILRADDISPAAKMTFACLLSYAWQNDYCFPGQERLAKDMGAGKRSVVRYIDELQKKGYIKITKRGLGKPNLYELRVDKAKTGKS